MPQNTQPRLVIFDSGVGGLSVLRALQAAVPEAAVTYLADDAYFPYSALGDAELAARVCDVMSQAIAAVEPDAVVIACNTASTVTLPLLRNKFETPIIGTVPAIKPAAQLSKSGLISVLGTSATVRRDYTRALIDKFGQGCQFTLTGSAQLAALAETVFAGDPVPDTEILAEIAPCFVEADKGCTDVVVLACTHYPLILETLKRLAPWPVAWLDPAPAIARRAAFLLAERGFAVGVGIAQQNGTAIFTSGKTSSPALTRQLDRLGLRLQSPPASVS